MATNSTSKLAMKDSNVVDLSHFGEDVASQDGFNLHGLLGSSMCEV